MALVDQTESISISDASKLGVSTLVTEAAAGHERIVTRDNKPVAAVVSIERLEQLEQLQDDLLDIALATARMLTTGPERHSLDDVLAQFGYTREQLRELPD